MKKITIPALLTAMAIITMGCSAPNTQQDLTAAKTNANVSQMSLTESNIHYKTPYAATKEKPAPIPFKDGTILEAHSLDYANRSYHKITDRATIADIASRLNDYTPAVSKDKNQVGFLIVTDKGKYDYYLDNDEKKASANDKPLIALAKKCNEKYFGSVQWLAFMSTSNIVGVTYNGFYFHDVNYKKRKGKASERLIDVATVDKTEIAIISSFLKSVVVDAKPKFHKGRTNPPTSGIGYQIGIEFANGSTYTIFGDEYEVIITSSDIDESIFYKCTKEQMYAMADMMASLNSAVDF